MKTVLMILMMAQEVEFKPVDQHAKVCRTHMTTHYKECSEPMEAKAAHLAVLKYDNLQKEWAYSYEIYSPAGTWITYPCVTNTPAVEWPQVRKENEMFGPVRQIPAAKKGGK